ncbi:MAG: hypothetical protein JSV51_05275 [Candidatus Bathyarchaeota archaeon]|nr:MAG: hypothetical protein JSV51_05275 [Candidatus Bathyarchaeota archaeon]
MGENEASSQILERVQKDLGEKNLADLEKFTIKISLKNLSREEKIQEASKPLYLKRYE